VPGLASKPYFWEQVLPDLAEAGYDARWAVVSAADVGAPHVRKRLWILAYPRSQGLEGLGSGACGTGEEESLPTGGSSDAGHADEKGQLQPPDPGWWETERGLGRVVNGQPNRMERLAALGDGQVPAVVVRAWEVLTCTR